MVDLKERMKQLEAQLGMEEVVEEKPKKSTRKKTKKKPVQDEIDLPTMDYELMNDRVSQIEGELLDIQTRLAQMEGGNLSANILKLLTNAKAFLGKLVRKRWFLEGDPANPLDPENREKDKLLYEEILQGLREVGI